MQARFRTVLIATFVILGKPAVAWAGMPSVTLSDLARMRVQAISFFLLCFLVSALFVQWIWNFLRRDFPRLPRLSFGRAVGVVALWGLLFVLVLTMISGARELMTPGAWKKEGLTYKLANEGPALVGTQQEPEPRSQQYVERRQALDRLRLALWTYARSHEGQLPPNRNSPEIPEEAWRVPDPSGMRYIYEGGKIATQHGSPLAYEPAIFGDERFVLLTDGKVRRMSVVELQQSQQGKPR